MDRNPPGVSLSNPVGNKRHDPRMGVIGSATADFLSPAVLRIANLSREGVGLSGVVRIGPHDSGLVTLELPGSDEPTTVVASLAWSDRKGHVGLKFMEFRTIATQWRTWFTARRAEGERAEDKSPLPTKVSVELAEAWRDAAADLRTELEAADRKSRITRWLWRGFRVTAAVLIITVAGAILWWWQGRPRAATPAAPPRAPLSVPSTQASPAKQQGRLVTTVHVSQGKPSLENPPEHGAPPPIEAGQATSQPEVRYTGSPLAVGEQVVHVLLTIDQKGIVSYVAVISGDAALARHVIATVTHWRYTPFLVDSTPVTVKLPVTASFRTTRVPAAGEQKKRAGNEQNHR